MTGSVVEQRGKDRWKSICMNIYWHRGLTFAFAIKVHSANFTHMLTRRNYVWKFILSIKCSQLFANRVLHHFWSNWYRGEKSNSKIEKKSDREQTNTCHLQTINHTEHKILWEQIWTESNQTKPTHLHSNNQKSTHKHIHNAKNTPQILPMIFSINLSLDVRLIRLKLIKQWHRHYPKQPYKTEIDQETKSEQWINSTTAAEYTQIHHQ